MTHEELMAKLKPKDTNFPIYSPISVLEALRAVTELHKPFMVKDKLLCEACCADVYLTTYPCETIRVIEKELV